MTIYTQLDHDDALSVLQSATEDARAAEPDAVVLLNAIASTWAAGEASDISREDFEAAKRTLSVAGRHHLRFAPVDPAYFGRTFLTPAMAWVLVDKGGKEVARFDPPEEGNRMISGPAELIGQTFKTRDTARHAVEQGRCG